MEFLTTPTLRPSFFHIFCPRVLIFQWHITVFVLNTYSLFNPLHSVIFSTEFPSMLFFVTDPLKLSFLTQTQKYIFTHNPLCLTPYSHIYFDRSKFDSSQWQISLLYPFFQVLRISTQTQQCLMFYPQSSLINPLIPVPGFLPCPLWYLYQILW